MANKLYDLGRKGFGDGIFAWTSDTIKASLVSSASYTPNYTTDQYYNVIPSGAIIAPGVALTSKTNVAGTLGAANTVWSAVSGSQAAFICLYKDTGTSSTSPLIGLIDTATGLPVTPNGGDITAAWSGGNIVTLCEALSDREIERILAGMPSVERSRWREFVADVRDRLNGLWLPEPRLIAA